MFINIISSVILNGGIGKDGDLLLKIPEDMKWFRKHTLGKMVVMGRLTYESIGKPLPERMNVVISSDPTYKPHEDVYVVDNPKNVLSSRQFRGHDIFIIGGQSIFEYFLPHADRIYLTEISVHMDADTFFPKINESEWKVKEITESKKFTDDISYRFKILERGQ